MLTLSYHDCVITVSSFATSNKFGKIRERSVKEVNPLQVKKDLPWPFVSGKLLHPIPKLSFMTRLQAKSSS